jgi:hypothetical protein
MVIGGSDIPSRPLRSTVPFPLRFPLKIALRLCLAQGPWTVAHGHRVIRYPFPTAQINDSISAPVPAEDSRETPPGQCQ